MNGWKLVPVEPTREMLVAALKTNGVCPQYAAMMAAAPQPPVGEPLGYVLTWNGEVYYEADDGVVISNTPGDELSERHRWVPVYTEQHVTARDQQTAALQARLAELEPLLASMTAAYRQAMQSGYDRITALGGECDPVERMLSDLPDYAKARVAMAQQVTK